MKTESKGVNPVVGSSTEEPMRRRSPYCGSRFTPRNSSSVL
jgi:hypothetical protein